jgi:hypothetical protein
LIYVAQSVRRKLFTGLRKTPEVSSLLKGDLDACLNRYVGSVGKLVSSDLTAATDMFPLDLVGAIVDGLVDADFLNEAEILALRRCTGPQSVSWPGDEAPSVTRRGILMGLPTTWALLNLVHLFWWKESLRIASDTTSKNAVFSMFGDDALISAEEPVIKAYNSMIESCGGKLSEGKHAVSSTRAVFLERLLEFNGKRKTFIHGIPIRVGSTRKGRITQSQARKMSGRKARLHVLAPLNQRNYLQFESWRYEGAIPLCGLMYPTSGGSTFDSRTVKAGPLWETLGGIVESLAQHHKSERIYAVQRHFYSKEMKDARARGLFPLPRILGGSGMLPSSRGWDEKIERAAGRSLRIALATLVTDESETRDPSAFTRAWAERALGIPDWVASDVTDVLTTQGYGRVRRGEEEKWKDRYVVDDLEERARAFFAMQASTMFGVPLTKPPRNQLMLKLNTTTLNLRNKWRSARPLRGSIRVWLERVQDLALEQSFQHSGVFFDVREAGTFGKMYPPFHTVSKQLMREAITLSLGDFFKVSKES